MTESTLRNGEPTPERETFQLADPGWNEATWSGAAPSAPPTKSLLNMALGASRLILFALTTIALLGPFFVARWLGGRRDRQIAALWWRGGAGALRFAPAPYRRADDRRRRAARKPCVMARHPGDRRSGAGSLRGQSRGFRLAALRLDRSDLEHRLHRTAPHRGEGAGALFGRASGSGRFALHLPGRHKHRRAQGAPVQVLAVFDVLRGARRWRSADWGAAGDGPLCAEWRRFGGGTSTAGGGRWASSVICGM